ncbi:MAG: FkbM family methyltransferase [Cyclobacteriaceae bacterium]
MEKLETKNYLQKRIVHFIFSEKWYNRIKVLKIIMNYKLGVPHELSPLLKELISSNCIVLDIGANMGQYACRINDIVKNGKGHVHCFEPVSDNFNSLKYLKEKLGLKSVTINQLGVSNVVGETMIYIPVFDNGLVIGTRSTLRNISETKHKKELIKVTTIDSYVTENHIQKIDFIKCDTEGNEINVLEGGKKTITRHLPVLSLEISYKSKGLDWLLDLGYEMYYYDNKINKLHKIVDYQSGNLILLNREHIERMQRIID